MGSLKAWIEAMRLRTLPVSAAGVAAGTACALAAGSFRTAPFLICLLFAVGAQVVSNFANEYFDYRNGLDRPGRDGFRRGVTEGDISPKAMRNATAGLLFAVSVLGASLIYWGGWWLVIPGIIIAAAALAYSAGPWPLSHHGLGEATVILFYGIVPVMFTAWLVSGSGATLTMAFWMGLAVGLMGADVMIVNNYRDSDDDRAAGKRTLAVRIGRNRTASLYMANGFLALLCMEAAFFARITAVWQLGPLLYINLHWLLAKKLRASSGPQLNPVLGQTAVLMCLTALWAVAAAAFGTPASPH